MVNEEIIASAIGAQAITSLILGLAGLLLLLIVFGWFASILNTKSRRAKELVSDLYVIGMIRQFAAKDGINLEEEMKNLRRIEKWERSSRRTIASMVETELNERIVAEGDKKVEEIKRSK